ncbi:YdeI family protein [Pedobacter sp. SYSU D00535]|uniref:YdeI/OmpD-associated family protein n=1 Tax=Pedobacter sp. SYSU D00535 TaxID=2810308 RepID=UPI001A9782AB|nr:YdeI/OmpD-associated family protein [Pedobacter sp. SYSU D00535]
MENALVRKLQIKPGFSVLLLNPPEGYIEKLQPLPRETTIHSKPQHSCNVVQLFVKNSEELKNELVELKDILTDDTIFWIMYPKKSSGIETDLGMMLSWDETSKYGLEPVASAAIDETWTALRFKPTHLIKRSEVKNASIGVNEYGDFIDVERKLVRLPEDLKTALEEVTSALDFFNSLAYSHKKEYVLWVLTAKQEKTRKERIEKTVNKLSQGKKNPTAK